MQFILVSSLLSPTLRSLQLIQLEYVSWRPTFSLFFNASYNLYLCLGKAFLSVGPGTLQTLPREYYLLLVEVV